MNKTRTADLSISRLSDRPDTLNAIVHWIDQEWGVLSGRTLSETAARFSQELDANLPLPLTFVALIDEIPVGVASLRRRDSTDWDPGATPWICNVFVSERARSKGVAGRLCRALETIAAEQGYQYVYLATTVAEDSLYHRLGYAHYKSYDHEHHPLYLLRLKLPTRNLS